MTQERVREFGQPVTLQTVADHVGTSVMTVSRALNGQQRGVRRKASARAELIRQTAEKLGYRRNLAAKAMVRGRFNAIGLLHSADADRNQLPPGRLAGLNAVLGRRGRSLVVSALPERSLVDEQFVPNILSDLMVDGVIVGVIRDTPRRLEELIENYRIPAIWVNSVHAHDSVCPADHDAAKQLTEHLLALGHRRIGFCRADPVSGSRFEQHYSVQARWDGYVQAMREAGLSPCKFQPDKDRPADRWHRHVGRWLEGPDRPTAMIAYWEPAAAAFMRAAMARRIDVPRELSIATFLDNPTTTARAIGLTGMVLPEREIGEVAGRMILKKAAAPEVRRASVEIALRFHRGASCVPPDAGR